MVLEDYCSLIRTECSLQSMQTVETQGHPARVRRVLRLLGVLPQVAAVLLRPGVSVRAVCWVGPPCGWPPAREHRPTITILIDLVEFSTFKGSYSIRVVTEVNDVIRHSSTQQRATGRGRGGDS